MIRADTVAILDLKYTAPEGDENPQTEHSSCYKDDFDLKYTAPEGDENRCDRLFRLFIIDLKYTAPEGDENSRQNVIPSDFVI